MIIAEIGILMISGYIWIAYHVQSLLAKPNFRWMKPYSAGKCSICHFNAIVYHMFDPQPVVFVPLNPLYLIV